MHRTHALLLVAALLLSGCGLLAVPAPNPTGGGGSGADPGGGANKPIGGGGGIVIPAPNDGAQRQTPDPTIVDAQPVAVDHWVIGPDGRSVVVYWWGGTPNCFGLHSVDVEVQDGVPVLTVNEGTLPEAVAKPCTMEALLKSALVTLDAPILSDLVGGAGPGEPQLPQQPLAVAVAAGVQNPMPHAVTGYSLAADGVTLQVYYVGGTDKCYALAEASAAGEDGVLVVSIKEGTLPNAGACDDIGVAKVATITLAAPLLRDGAQ